MFKKSRIKFSIAGERDFKLEEDVVYTGKTDTFTVPAGFVTDFASVPPAISWLIPSYGKYTLAAVVHDWLCVDLRRYYDQRKAGGDWFNYTAPYANARDTDAIFRRIMRELDVPFLRRWIMWTGVRWGAANNPARRAGLEKDLPLMLLWSMLSAPLVVPATIIVWIGLFIDRVFENIVGGYLR